MQRIVWIRARSATRAGELDTAPTKSLEQTKRGTSTLPVPGLPRLLARLNQLPIGSRRVRVGDDWLVADSLDRLVACLAWKLGWLERRERLFLARSVRPGMVAVDVGANIGFHTFTLARAVGPSGRVHAVEPDPRNFAALARAVDIAGLRQILPHNVAAVARSGPTWLDLSPSNRGDHRVASPGPARTRIAVEGVALDELLDGEARVDFVKIDVQGGEADVLRGLEGTLRRNPALVLLCELCPRLLARAGTSFGAFFEPLERAGFAPRTLDREAALVPAEPERLWAQACGAGYLNVVFQRP